MAVAYKLKKEKNPLVDVLNKKGLKHSNYKTNISVHSRHIDVKFTFTLQ